MQRPKPKYKQEAVLNFLRTHSGDYRIDLLYAEMGVSKGTVFLVMHNLLKERKIVKVRNPHDGRIYYRIPSNFEEVKV